MSSTNHQLQPTVDRSRSTSSLSSSSAAVHGADISESQRNRSRSKTRSPSNRRQPEQNRDGRDLNKIHSDVQPLLDTDVEMIPRIIPPMAETETDGDDSDGNRIPNTPDLHPGVDGGFFTGEDDDDSATKHDSVDGDFKPNFGPRLGDDDNGGTDMDRASPRPPLGGSRRPSFPGSTDFEAGFAGVPIVIPDVNVYQQKKTLAQGMMDLALLTANANQLRYVLESSDAHPYKTVSLIFIAMSIILQIAVGVGLIWNSRYNVKNEADICKADKINNFTVMGIFMITTVNVFITSFSVANQNSSVVASISPLVGLIILKCIRFFCSKH